MKKLILIFGLILISFFGYSQNKPMIEPSINAETLNEKKDSCFVHTTGNENIYDKKTFENILISGYIAENNSYLKWIDNAGTGTVNTMKINASDEVEFGIAINAPTLNTGQGSNELYAMNQDVENTDAVTFITLNTGEGDNELFDMDQNVLTTSDFTGNSFTMDDMSLSLCQGVTWNSAADTYTRLGSLKGIMTGQSAGDDYLPIQSDMKRCLLADDGTVNHYLDADNSAMIDEMTIPYSDSINYVNGDTIIVTGASFTTTADTGMWVHNVDSSLYAEIISIISNDTLILSDSIFVIGDSINQYNAILNGDDGQIMVEIPKFYHKHDLSGTVNSWYISKYDLPEFDLHPAFWKDGQEIGYRYISAFEGSMWDATTSTMVAKADIINNMYASGDKMCSIAGTWAKTNEQRAEYRLMAAERGTGFRQLDYYLISAIQLLYLVEYADFNSQSMIGMGRTELSGGSWVADSYIGMTGMSIGDGNGTNSVSNGTTLGYLTDYMTYRGVENLFGNVWKMIDGIAWDGRWTGVAAAQPVYVTNNSTYFADQVSTNMQYLCDATYIGTDADYISNIENVTGFIPSVGGSSSTTYICDYYYQYSEVGKDYWRVVLVGGFACAGGEAGVFSLSAANAWSDDYATIAGRLCF